MNREELEYELTKMATFLYWQRMNPNSSMQFAAQELFEDFPFLNEFIDEDITNG